jgi:hypothetical protein
LPTKFEAEVLYQQYFNAVDPLADIIHKPSFFHHGRFWEISPAGFKITDADVALILCMCFAATVSMDALQIQGHFGLSKRITVDRFKAAELALKRAHFMIISKMKVLQAFTMYMVRRPASASGARDDIAKTTQCLGDISRSHSVLVGALSRLAQYTGINRLRNDTNKITPLQSHVQRLLWHQILFSLERVKVKVRYH